MSQPFTFRSVNLATLAVGCCAFWMIGCSQSEVSNQRAQPGFLMEFPPSKASVDAWGPDTTADRHELIDENGFVSVADHPLSTFSIDVDTASYSKVRQHLIDYQRLPRRDVVRVEELINYFSYDYPDPPQNTGEVLATHYSVAQCPWNLQHRLIRVGIKGKDVDWSKRPAVNLVLLLDTSGSMNAENKLPLLQRALRMLLGELDERDRIAIVAYAGSAGLVLDSTPANQTDKIIHAINSLAPGGSTHGSQGLEMAYAIAREHFAPGQTNRVLMCTDGDFNVGQQSDDQLIRLVSDHSKSGIDLTVLGFGMGNLNDSMLEKISGRGNGNYAFIDNANEARKVLVEQMAGTLVTIARDVKIQVEFNPTEVAGYRLIGYENRQLEDEDFLDDQVDAGEIGAGHTVTAFYEVIPVGSPSAESLRAVKPLKYSASKPVVGAADGELMTIQLRYHVPDDTQVRSAEHVVFDSPLPFAKAEEDFRFAASVVGFAMALRQSDHRGTWQLSDVKQAASSSLGRDRSGFRGEFLEMVDAAIRLQR